MLRVCVCVHASDIFGLTRLPELHKRWISATAQRIRDNRTRVDAVVGPATRRFLFAHGVALDLNLPFIPIHKAGKLLADRGDIIEETYINRDNEVKAVFLKFVF